MDRTPCKETKVPYPSQRPTFLQGFSIHFIWPGIFIRFAILYIVIGIEKTEADTVRSSWLDTHSLHSFLLQKNLAGDVTKMEMQLFVKWFL